MGTLELDPAQMEVSPDELVVKERTPRDDSSTDHDHAYSEAWIVPLQADDRPMERMGVRLLCTHEGCRASRTRPLPYGTVVGE